MEFWPTPLILFLAGAAAGALIAANGVLSAVRKRAGRSRSRDDGRRVRVGLEVAKDDNWKIFRGKKVGVVSNPTGVLPTTLEHAVDVMPPVLALIWAMVNGVPVVAGGDTGGDGGGDGEGGGSGEPSTSRAGVAPLPPENECISLDCTNASAAFYVQGFGDGFGDGFDA